MTDSISTRLTTFATMAAAALTLTLAPAAQADTGLTRQQVQAELAEAQRTGTLVDYETGRPLKDIFPGAYAKAVPAAAASNRATAASLHDLPPTSAGPQATKAVPGGAPWDYEAISRRSAELLDGSSKR